MKALEKQFIGRAEVKGDKFTQISSAKRGFLYEVNTGYSIYYEVFKKVVNKRFSCISYPTAKDFGYWAWTFSSLEEATEKFNQLNQKKK